MDESTPVINDRAVDAWLRKMTSPAPIKGHAYRRDAGGAWCACGRYLGGLTFDQLKTATEIAHAKRQHALHLVVIKHCEAPNA